MGTTSASATASVLVRRARLKLSRAIGGLPPLRMLEDWLRARHQLSPENVARIEATLRQCRSAEDYYDLASQLLPAHQIKSEISSFLRFAACERPRVVCEIGTAEGGTTFLLSHAIPSVELIVGIDLFVWNRRLLQRFGRPGARMSLLNGSSYAQGTVERVRRILGGRAIDLLFVDGDHTYRGVARDLLAYSPLVREGGLIAFHDIVPDYMTRFGRATGRWAGEVPRLWSRIRPLFEHQEIVDDPEQDGLGIGVIRYKSDVELSLE